MTGYREASVYAVGLINSGEEPAVAWKKATKKFFPVSTNLQDKSCPKGAFLGLCNAGLIKGVPPGSYTRATKNGSYAVKAVDILKQNRFLVSQLDMLWKKIAPTISHNHQLEVVVGLWKADLIKSVHKHEVEVVPPPYRLRHSDVAIYHLACLRNPGTRTSTPLNWMLCAGGSSWMIA